MYTTIIHFNYIHYVYSNNNNNNNYTFFNSEYGRINVYDILMQYRVSQKQLDP